jgi:hypothetical protein
VAQGLKSSPRSVVFALFLLTRIVLLFIDAPESTLLGVDVQYAFEVQRAAALGLPFYKVHEINRAEDNPGSSQVERQVEYPPLAILWMTVPTWFIDPLPKTGLAPESLQAAAKQATRIAMFVVDLCGFGLFWWMGAEAASLAIYAVFGLLLYPLLYDRMDLVLGVLLLAVVAAVVRRLPDWVPLLVLAIAINFKLTPLVLAPVFVLGTMPADELRSWRAIAKRAALLAVFTAGVFLPFFIRDGSATLGFLQYHVARGLQLEATWSTIPAAAAALFRAPAQVVFRYGAFEVQSGITGALLALASIAMVLLIPALAWVFWKQARARGAASPKLMINCSAAFLLAAIVSAKVFSPQYLLWVGPLIALWSGKRKRLVWASFLVVCALTTLCYPFGYGRLMEAIGQSQQLAFSARLIGIAPLVLRNLLLVMLAVLCWRDMEPAERGESIPAAATRPLRGEKRTRAR